jgi:hypothetical protein
VRSSTVVGDDAGHQDVAQRRGLAQQVEVPDVEQVVGAGRVADDRVSHGETIL